CDRHASLHPHHDPDVRVADSHLAVGGHGGSSGKTDYMYAITIAETGGPEVLTWCEVPDPRPAAGEVVIDVRASAVNRADVLQRQGLYPPPPGASPYPGLECSGVISEIGPDVTDWQVG